MNSENFVCKNSENKREVPCMIDSKLLFFSRTTFLNDLKEEITKKGLIAILKYLLNSNKTINEIAEIHNFFSLNDEIRFELIESFIDRIYGASFEEMDNWMKIQYPDAEMYY